MQRSMRTWVSVAAVAWLAATSLAWIAAPAHAATTPPLSPPPAPTSASSLAAPPSHASLPTSGPMVLNATASPVRLCAYASSTCPGLGNTTRITLTASVTAAPPSNWTSVQVLFLLETGLYDGACGNGVAPTATGLCPGAYLDNAPAGNLSLFLPLFAANAGTMTAAIAANHPGVTVTYGLADFQSTFDTFDNADGFSYRVDIGSFLPAAPFATQLNRSSFATNLWDRTTTDNILHGPAITALFGALTGVGLNWSNAAHHVIVLVGSMAPRDPAYPENYCPLWGQNPAAPGCDSPTCEPSNASAYEWSNGGGYYGRVGEYPASFLVPHCEGWARSASGNSSASVAALALAAPPCAGSSGGRCTIDVIDLNATPTDPLATAWSGAPSNGDGSQYARNDTAAVLRAGCDLASATGGTWAGPSGSRCASGATGAITGDVGSTVGRQAENASLLAAVGAIGFGGGFDPATVIGASAAMFGFHLAPGTALAPHAAAVVTCTTPTGPIPSCDIVPRVVTLNGTTHLAWNWSDAAGQNELFPGDVWTASFEVVVFAAPNASLPLDTCNAPGCPLGGALGTLSEAAFKPATNDSTEHEPFPPILVAMVAPPSIGGTLFASPHDIDVAQPVLFTITAAGGVPPYRAVVDFRDGSPPWTDPGLAAVTHVYAVPGAYDPTVTLTDAIGATWEIGEVVSVNPGLSVALATPATTTVGPSPTPLAATPTGGLPPYQVLWRFADGTLLAGAAVSYTYSSPGSFPGNVSVEDATGATTTAAFTVVVAPASAVPPPPVLSATASLDGLSLPPPACPTQGPSQVIVAFGAGARSGVAPYQFIWTFGDGSPASLGANVSHEYRASGAYSATVRVVDASGAVAYASVPVDITLPAPSCPSTPATMTYSHPAPTSTNDFWYLAAGLSLVAVVLLVRQRRGRR
jgi:PKD repeat protein